MKNNTSISICGSMKFASDMKKLEKNLLKFGFNVYTPKFHDKSKKDKESGSSFEATKIKIQNDYIRNHFKSIQKSQGILVCNMDKDGVKNYIGGNTLMEMGFAHTMNRDIFLLNSVPDMSYKSEIEAMQPIVINGNLEKIKDYYDKLPKVYVSSESPLKITATSLGLREFKYRYDVQGLKTNSGITEEPYTIEEAYLGAENRLKDLKKQLKKQKYKLLVSIESGNVILHKKHNTWGFSVCIIEDENGKSAVTIDTDLEIPKEMTDLVPSKYPDLGVLVQQKYGEKFKDPYLHITHGKLSREKLLFNSVVNTLSLI